MGDDPANPETGLETTDIPDDPATEPVDPDTLEDGPKTPEPDAIPD